MHSASSSSPRSTSTSAAGIDVFDPVEFVTLAEFLARISERNFRPSSTDSELVLGRVEESTPMSAHRIADDEEVRDVPYVMHRRARLGIPVDWELAMRAMREITDRLGWDAEFELDRENHHVWVLYPPDRLELVVSTRYRFYRAMEEVLGVERFSAVDLDFGGRE